MDLIVLADTSASIDAAARANQAKFLAALLAALGPKDRVRLAACDVKTVWFSDQPLAEHAGEKALAWLAARPSLGSSDLDSAFATALAQAGPETQVLYLGDGVPTAGDRDPEAFCKRLQRLYEGKTAACHAIALSSRYEPGVMRTIAGLGGGSFRAIDSRGPQAAVVDLLAEILRPGLRNLHVEFLGLRTARVYPTQLPNLPAGSQQIVLGRYLPEGKDQQGQVVVTGTENGKPVRFTASVVLKDGEEGNAFIPRLWARMHLDELLAQGRSAAVRDEIIALSEEYHIITPYTSLLVLESDADRQRFGVKRRFQMRDAERFFAEGQDHVRTDLLQDAMQRAGTWRTGLRRAVLQELRKLGRDPMLFDSGLGGGYFGGMGGMGGMGGGMGGMGGMKESVVFDAGVSVDARRDPSIVAQEEEEPLGIDEQSSPDGEEEAGEDEQQLPIVQGRVELEGMASFAGARQPSAQAPGGEKRFNVLGGPAAPGGSGNPWGDLESNASLIAGTVAPTAWRHSDLAPFIPEIPSAELPAVGPSRWPMPAQEIAKRLYRAPLPDGLQIVCKQEKFDPAWGDPTERRQETALVRSGGWASRTETDGEQTTVQWCDGHQRAILGTAFLLGARRVAKPDELARPPLALPQGIIERLDLQYPTERVEVRAQGQDRVLLVVPLAGPSGEVVCSFLIDTARNAVLREEMRGAERGKQRTEYGDLVEVAGRWWPGKAETFDEQGRLVARRTFAYGVLPPADLDRQWKAMLAPAGQAQLFSSPLPKLTDARKAAAQGKAGVDERAALMVHCVQQSQWPRALAELGEIEKLSGKPGIRWLRLVMLVSARRHEEAKKQCFDEARRLAPGRGDDYSIAQELANRGSEFFGATEQLELLDLLGPIYPRTDAAAVQSWLQLRIAALEQAGRWQDARQAEHELAERFPHDAEVQLKYATHILAAPAAIERLGRLIDQPQWPEDTRDRFRVAKAVLLVKHGKVDDLLAFAVDWANRSPTSVQGNLWRLTALIYADRYDEARKLYEAWLEGAISAKTAALDLAVEAKAMAAVQLAAGKGGGLSRRWFDRRSQQLLAGVVLADVRRESPGKLAATIVGENVFLNSDVRRAVDDKILAWLETEADRAPAAQVRRRIELLSVRQVSSDRMARIATVLRKRWAAARGPEQQDLAAAIAIVLRGDALLDARIDFLRANAAAAEPELRAWESQGLFEALIERWTPEREAEALAILPKLALADDPDTLATRLYKLHRLTDAMVQFRVEAGLRAIGHPEKLTRTEYRTKRREATRAARLGYAALLAKAAAKQEGPLRRWMTAERLYLEALAGQDLPRVVEECWELLGGDKQPAIKPEGLDHAAVLRQRLVAMLSHLAARRDAKPEEIQRLLVWLDARIEEDPYQDRWKQAKAQLLIALERTKELETALREWIAWGDWDFTWRQTLGNLLAEQGRLEEAAAVFEAARPENVLTADDYHALARWQLALGRKDAHRDTKIKAFRQYDEQSLCQWLDSKRVEADGSNEAKTTPLDPDVPIALAVLFIIAPDPQPHWDLVAALYRQSRDFRVLGCLPNAVRGHTWGRTHALIAGLGPLLEEIQDEATIDRLVEAIGQTRALKLTAPSRRALDLLEARLECRAASLENQAKPRAERALAALRRLVPADWKAGEPQSHAAFLASLGVLPDAKLIEEQARQFELAYRASAEGSEERASVAENWARTCQAYQKAIAGNAPQPFTLAHGADVLKAALDQWRQSLDREAAKLPPERKDDLLAGPTDRRQAVFVSHEEESPLLAQWDVLIGLWESQEQFATAERMLLDEARRPFNPRHRQWIEERLGALYIRALRSKAEVSLGRGAQLYRAVEKKLLAAVRAADNERWPRLVEMLMQLYEAAHILKIEGVANDATRFAAEVPALLKQPGRDGASAVERIEKTLRPVVGEQEVLEFLVACLEQEPIWSRLDHVDLWDHVGGSFAPSGTMASMTPPLETRLEKLVVARLRTCLETRQDLESGYLFKQGSLWKAKKLVFLKVAEEVLAENKDSAATTLFVAEYLYTHLGEKQRAAEVLWAAHGRKLLDDQGESRLADFLLEVNRPADAIAVLEPLVAREPEDLRHRTRLMSAFFQAGQPQKVLATLDAADAFFHQGDRWEDDAIIGLGYACLSTNLNDRAAAYFREAIGRRTAEKTVADHYSDSLSTLYARLAQAERGRGDLTAAVDAACAAIVAGDEQQRKDEEAFEILVRTLQEANDLKPLIVQLDKQVRETGMDKPVVRKALGTVLFDEGKLDEAIVQLEAAAAAQPNDPQVYEKLVQCFDQKEDPQGVIRQMLRWIAVEPRNKQLYDDLAERYETLERPADAERARTSVRDVAPDEAEAVER